MVISVSHVNSCAITLLSQFFTAIQSFPAHRLSIVAVFVGCCTTRRLYRQINDTVPRHLSGAVLHADCIDRSMTPCLVNWIVCMKNNRLMRSLKITSHHNTFYFITCCLTLLSIEHPTRVKTCGRMMNLIKYVMPDSLLVERNIETEQFIVNGLLLLTIYISTRHKQTYICIN